MDNTNNINDDLNTDVLFEGLNLSTKETVAGCAMAVYLNSVGKGAATGLMDKIVDVKVFALDPKVFFATPKCRKLQSKNVGCCNCKMQKVAELCVTAI